MRDLLHQKLISALGEDSAKQYEMHQKHASQPSPCSFQGLCCRKCVPILHDDRYFARYRFVVVVKMPNRHDYSLRSFKGIRIHRGAPIDSML